MKKIIWLAIFFLSVLMSYSQNFSMKSTNSGISLQASGGIGGWKSKDFGVESENGTAFSLQLGYGFNENMEIIGGAQILKINPKDEFFLPFTLQEIKIGAKYTFGSTLNPLRFHASASIAWLNSSQGVADYDWFFDEIESTFHLSGVGANLSAGAKYHLKLPIAITLDVAYTFGKLNNNYLDDLQIEDLDYGSHAIKIGAIIYFNQL